jgi:restriction endonuclease S subunit
METKLVPIQEIRKKGVWHFQPYSQAVQRLETVLEQSRFPVVKLQDFVESAKRGFIHQGFLETEGILLIQPKNLTAIGLDLSDPTYITPEDHHKLLQTQVRPGDVVISLVAQSRPAIAVVYTDNRPANITNNLACLHLLPQTNPAYLTYYLNSDIGQALLQSHMTGSAMRTISIKALLDIPIIYPPLDEQSSIMAKIQSLQQESIRLSDQAITIQSEARHIFEQALN